MINIQSLTFGVFDICIILILIISGIVGYHNGFVKEVINILIWLISIFTTFLFLDESIKIFSTFINAEIIVNIISFLIPLCIFFLIFIILFKIFFNNLNEISNFFIDRFLGFIFGILKGVFFVIFCFGGLIYLFNSKENFPNIISNSLLFEPVKNISIYAFDFLFYTI
tara:strand:- start:25 stop:528 length:504 start_codon:yes stop_codon:yes gene_type:complete